MTRSRSAPPRRQSGVATLAIVAILFFIVSLVAAYTNRNLIFEQRTSTNQLRSTLAFEAAEGGVDWVLAQLNAGRIDASCVPTDDTTATTFRERYLAVAADGMITPVANVSVACVRDADNGWSCDCPAAGTPAPDDAGGTGVRPAFRARFVVPSGPRPGVIGLEVNGCTRLNNDCLGFPAVAVGGEGRATVALTLALRSALPAPPVTAITVRGDFRVNEALGAFNPDPTDGGFAVLAGGDFIDVHGRLQVGSAPGTPADVSRLVLFDDGPLSDLPDADAMFTSTFMLLPGIYREQPGTVVLDCTDGCDGDDVRAMAALQPGRIIWIDGDVALDGADPIGSAASPVVLVIEGAASIDGTVYGVVYVRQPDPADASVPWDAQGSGTLNGALIVEGGMDGDARFTVVRDRDVLTTVQRRHGSFVRVPGSWRDF